MHGAKIKIVMYSNLPGMNLRIRFINYNPEYKTRPYWDINGQKQQQQQQKQQQPTLITTLFRIIDCPVFPSYSWFVRKWESIAAVMDGFPYT